MKISFIDSLGISQEELALRKKPFEAAGHQFAEFSRTTDIPTLIAQAQDADAMTAAFKEYAAKSVKKQNRPSILAKLEQFKNLIKSAVVDRTKKKEHER